MSKEDLLKIIVELPASNEGIIRTYEFNLDCDTGTPVENEIQRIMRSTRKEPKNAEQIFRELIRNVYNNFFSYFTYGKITITQDLLKKTQQETEKPLLASWMNNVYADEGMELNEIQGLRLMKLLDLPMQNRLNRIVITKNGMKGLNCKIQYFFFRTPFVEYYN